MYLTELHKVLNFMNNTKKIYEINIYSQQHIFTINPKT